MNSKITSTLEKALQEKRKGQYDRALRRLTDALSRFPDDVELYIEAADVCLEGGESLQGAQYLRKAYKRFAAEKGRLDAFALEKLRATGDPILSKCLLDWAVKRRDLEAAVELLEDLPDRAIRELLQRSRTKKQTLNSAARGGHALVGEMVLNLLSEGLLCLRLGRMKEATRAFLEIIDDKPVENEVLEPFLGLMEKKHNKVGRIRYAYACSLIVAQQFDKAMLRLVQGVKMEPKIADDALDRLRELSDKFETAPDCVEDALVEIMLVKGETVRVCEILNKHLSEDPDVAGKIMELVKPYAEAETEGLLLHYLYMDAALVADMPRRALEMIKKLADDPSARDDVYQWLESKSKEQFFPPDIMLLHGRMALKRGEHDRGLEILRAVIASSPNDAGAVLSAVEKHKNSAPVVKAFYEEQVKAQRSPSAQSGDGFEFEHFENKEFSFSGGKAPAPPVDETKPEDIAGHVEVLDAAAEIQPRPVAGDGEAPFAGETSILNGSGSSDDPFSEPGETETEDIADFEGPGIAADAEESVDVADAGGDIAVNPLERGLEEAARRAVDGGVELIWEEEDADGEIERTEAGKNDSWLETRRDPVAARAETGRDTRETRETKEAPGVDEPPVTDEFPAVEETPEPDQTSIADETPEAGETLENEEVPDANEADATEARDAEPPEEESEPVDSPPQPEAPEERAEPEAPETQETPTVEAEKTVDDSFDNKETTPATPGYETDADRVAALAEALRDTGARLFFHVEEDEPPAKHAAPETPPEERAEPEAATEPEAVEEPEPATEPEALEEPEEIEVAGIEAEMINVPEERAPEDPFEADFSRYLDGGLDDDEALSLAREALSRGRLEEARELLHVRPSDDAAETRRKRLLGEYYLAAGLPGAALEILEAIDTRALDERGRSAYERLKARCETQTNESIQRVEETIPPKANGKKGRRRHERSLNSQIDDALVLEKTTSLHGE